MTLRRPSFALVVVICLVARIGARQASTSQSPQPTFASRSDLVRLDVVVVDKDGNAVRGLQSSDFTILDRKRPQAIVAFVEQTRDQTTGREGSAELPQIAMPTLKMDVATNQLPADDRLVVIVIDDLHLYKNRTDRAQKIARDLLNQLGAGSAVAVLFTSGEHNTEITQQSSEALEAISTLRGRRAVPRPVFVQDTLDINPTDLAIYLGSQGRVSATLGSSTPAGTGASAGAVTTSASAGDSKAVTSTSAADTVDPPRFATPNDVVLQDYYDSMQAHKTLEDAANLLATSTADRKAFIVISEGVADDLAGLFDGGAGEATPCQAKYPLNACTHQVALRQMMAALRRSNVTYYAIDPRGRVAPKDLERECFPEKSGTDPCLGDGDPNGPSDWTSWVRQAQHGLDFTAKATGGLAITDTDDFATGVKRVVSDIDHCYLLGFRPARVDESGYHDVEIKVDRPDVTVRARSGYETGKVEGAPRSKKEDTLATLIKGILPTSALPLRTFAAPMPISGKKTTRVAVALEITAPVSALLEPDRKLHDEVSYDVFVVDGNRSKVTSRSAHAARLVLAPAERGPMPTTVTYQVPLTLDLEPGSYQLRAAAESKKLNVGGSVYLKLDVPDFSKEALGLGGIVVGYADGPHVPVGHLTNSGASRLEPARAINGEPVIVAPAQLAAMRAAETSLPFDPSLSREFLRTDALRVYAAVTRKESKPAKILIELLDAGDRSVVSSTHELSPKEAVVDVRFALSGVSQGVYRLRVTATEGSSRAARETIIILK